MASMVTTLTPPSVADRARQLVAASQRQTLDPFVAVDWERPLDASGYYLPPEFLPLYGTAVWDSMAEADRILYSKHESAALCAAGIWFENILMQLMLHHLYDLPATDGSHRYLLVETADECRHSTMFGEIIRRGGTPAYQVHRLLQWGGKILTTTTRGIESYVAMLAAEELLDVTNRATMKDERCHGTAREIAKVHVMEEARHVSYARTYITEVWPTLSWIRRIVAMVRVPFVVRAIAEGLVNPAVYRELEIDNGYWTARTNPVHNERVVRDLGKLTDLLADIGIINTFTRPFWQVLGLV